MGRLQGTTAPIGPGPPAWGTGSPAQEAVAAYGAPAGHGSPHWPRPTSLGDGESCPRGGRCPWSACGGRLPPSARAHQLGGPGVVPRRRSLPMERVRGTAAPIGPGPPARGTRSPVHEAVAAYGPPAGDSSPHWPRPTSLGDGESCPRGGHRLWSVWGGHPSPLDQAHQLGGRGFLSRRRSLPMERLRGTAAPIGAGPPAGGWKDLLRRQPLPMERMQGTAAPIGPRPQAWGTGSPAHEAVAAYGTPAGDGSPHRHGPTSSGDGESCPGGNRCLWGACGGRQPPSARAHQLGGQGVLSRRRSLPMERLRGTAAPIGPSPPAWGTGSPTLEAAAADGAPEGGRQPRSVRAHQLGVRESCPGGESLHCTRTACYF